MDRDYLLADVVEHLQMIKANFPLPGLFLEQLEQYRMIEPVSSDELDAMLKEKGSLQREFSRLENSVLDAEEIMQDVARDALIAVKKDAEISQILFDNNMQENLYNSDIYALRRYANIITSASEQTIIDRSKNISFLLDEMLKSFENVSDRNFDAHYKFPVKNRNWGDVASAYQHFTSAVAGALGNLSYVAEKFRADMPRYRKIHEEIKQMDARIAEVHSVGSELYRITRGAKDMMMLVNQNNQMEMWNLRFYAHAREIYDSTAGIFCQTQTPSNPSGSQHLQDCMQ